MAKNKKPQKTLLSEHTVRRMMKLAAIPELSDGFVREAWGKGEKEYKREEEDGVETKAGDVGGHYKDYEDDTGEKKGDESSTHPGRRDYMKEEDEEAELAATEDELGAEDEVADEEASELDAGASEGEAEITPEQAAAVVELAPVIADLAASLEAGGAVEGGEVEVEAEIEDLGGDEMEAEEEVEEIEESLAKLGIQVVDDNTINETVRKRVVARLLKEKRAQDKERTVNKLVDNIFARLQKRSK